MIVIRRQAALCLLLLAAAVAAVAADGGDWSDCSDGPTAFKVKDVTLNPSPVQPGQLAKFSIEAESAKEVTGGTVQMIVHYAGLPIWTQIDSLCDKADCPIEKGPTEVHYSQLFPYITPPGSYSVTLNGHSGDEPLFCVTVDFQVVPPEAANAAGSAVQAAKEAAQKAFSASRKVLV